MADTEDADLIIGYLFSVGDFRLQYIVKPTKRVARVGSLTILTRVRILSKGDLQLILVPDSSAVTQQCSTAKLSILDKNLLKNSSPSTLAPAGEDEMINRLRRRHRPANKKQPVSTDSDTKYVFSVEGFGWNNLF